MDYSTFRVQFSICASKSNKGQAIVDFLTEHQESQDELVNIPRTLEVASLWVPPSNDHSGKEEWIHQEVKRITSLWIIHLRLYLDGPCTQHAAGARIVII
ncbi:hypothetical protein ACFX2K_003568 [Malus domestica]